LQKLLQDVTSDLQITNPQVNVDIDRDKASALGITANQVEDALYTAYGQRQISTIYAPNNAYRVITELENQYQLDPSALSLLYVRSSNGQLVPLNAVARLTRTLGPLTINHLGQLPAVTISFNLRPGVSLGDAVNAVGRTAREMLPASVSTSFQGTAQAFESSISGLGLLLVMAILVIYLVLGILYESFIHPLTILSGLPSAGFGALITLMLFHLELNLYGFVGVIMLVGIVKKKCHYDDRCGPGAAARQPRPGAGGNLSGSLAALPSHHDDHHGGAHGHAADRARFWRGRGITPPAGTGRGRRAGIFPAADSVHYSRLLHLHGFVPELASLAPEAQGASGRRI
jgi:hypothetical protein